MTESSDIIKLLLTSSGPAVLLVLAGLFWGKAFIKYFFDKTIELKKTELNQNLESYKSQIDLKSKDFQNQLDKKLNDFNIRFSKLHNHRAEVIKELYLKLVELHASLFFFSRTIHPIIHDARSEEAARLERLNKAIFDFNDYMVPNKIYFTKQMASKMENIANTYYEISSELSYAIRTVKDHDLGQEVRKPMRERINEISNMVDKDFTLLIEELENEFRIILGVD